VSPTPWDARVARRLVPPLRALGVHPNLVTTAGLLTGLGAAALYAHGGVVAANAAAGLFLVTAVLDHADGELARATGRTSAFGHQYDRVADLIVKIAIFTGMGLGVRGGARPVLLGAAAGVSVVAIFLLRGRIAALRGNQALRQPSFAGFELEDVLYLVVVSLTWLGHVEGFLVCVGIGAPLFALWIGVQYRRASAPEARAMVVANPRRS
jgi:phosphatidylglycerophosphate synthase